MKTEHQHETNVAFAVKVFNQPQATATFRRESAHIGAIRATSRLLDPWACS